MKPKLTEEEEIWLELANLFFLDSESDERDFVRVATFLKKAGWDRLKTEQILVERIAPCVGGNLWSVAGVWGTFDAHWLSERVHKRTSLRERKPKWAFFFSDWWYRRMLRRLDTENLLKRI